MLNIGFSTLPAIGKSVCRLCPFIQPQSAKPNGAGPAEDAAGAGDGAGAAGGAGATGIVARVGAGGGGGAGGVGVSACARAAVVQTLAPTTTTPTINTRLVLEFTMSSIERMPQRMFN